MLIGLVGCGGFGREIMPLFKDFILSMGVNVTPVFVDSNISTGFVNGYRVVSEEEFGAHEDGDKRFNVAIGDSRSRQKVAERMIEIGAVPLHIRSNMSAVYDLNLIGDGSIICAGSVITSNATIGRFFHSNLHSYVAHDCVIGDFVTFAPRVSCNGNVIIEDHAYVGTGAILKQGTPSKPLRIGKGAIIGMGAVVTKDVPAGETWIGNPARPMVKA